MRLRAPSPAARRRRSQRHARRATVRSERCDGRERVRRNRCGFAGLRLSSGASAFRKRAISRLASSSSASLSRVRGSARCSEDVSPARRFSSSTRKRARSCSSPPLPPRGRVPRNSASSSTSAAFLKLPCAAPSRHSGCFNRPAASAARVLWQPLRPPVARRFRRAVSISASPPESSKARFQRARAAATRRASRAIRRHQGCRFFEVTRLAHRNRDRQRFGLGIVRLDQREISHAERNLRGDRRARPAAAASARSRSAGRIASERRTSRPRGGGFARDSTSPRLIANRCSSACIAYCG